MDLALVPDVVVKDLDCGPALQEDGRIAVSADIRSATRIRNGREGARHIQTPMQKRTFL